MSSNTDWRYDEFQQVGKDYGRQEEVEVYDSSHAEFRDVDRENEETLRRLRIRDDDTLVDFGSGTGAFVIAAAKHCRLVHAVDVSKPMLAFARAKAEAAGRANMRFHHDGFLSYEREGDTASVVTTSYSFHHLPDFWKGIALARIARMLSAGGRLFIRDVVIEEANAVENVARFIDSQARKGGDFLREDAEGHFREEFSTYDWVMDGLLERAGFAVLEKEIVDGVIGTYLCAKR